MRRLGIFHEQVMDPLIDAIESSEAAESPEDERIKRTKVAVIDTGICWEDPFIAGVRDRIKETCNWVPDKTGLVNTFDVEDRFGHGTQTALLLLKVAPGVEVCIARVSEDGLLDNASYVAEVGRQMLDTQNKALIFAQAITWAVQNCQADIITMSFGFEERSDIVLDAVLAAYKERKILFAAASNGGGNDDIAFPANQREVIGVFSTDGGGNASLFNPTFPDMDDGSYFSTLGEAVELYSLPVRDAKGTPVFNKTRKSGTSFATPIAAGIAANILDYAKAKRNIGEESLRQLHNFSGMIAVLKLLAPGKRNDHNYLCPWKLWKDRPAKARERDADLIRTQILIELKA
jgi:subtilisin family serine protease